MKIFEKMKFVNIKRGKKNEEEGRDSSELRSPKGGGKYTIWEKKDNGE